MSSMYFRYRRTVSNSWKSNFELLVFIQTLTSLGVVGIIFYPETRELILLRENLNKSIFSYGMGFEVYSLNFVEIFFFCNSNSVFSLFFFNHERKKIEKWDLLNFKRKFKNINFCMEIYNSCVTILLEFLYSWKVFKNSCRNCIKLRM